MNLQVPISIFDELSDEVIRSTGSLDLASGEIRSVTYEDYDVAKLGLPADQEDYEFTSGMLSNDGKDVEFRVEVDVVGGKYVEFRVEVDVVGGKYSVSASELLEIKVRAAKLFAGIEGRDLAGGTGGAAKPKPPNGPAAKPAGNAPPKSAGKKYH